MFVAIMLDFPEEKILIVNTYLKPKTAKKKVTKGNIELTKMAAMVKQIIRENGISEWIWGGDFNMDR